MLELLNNSTLFLFYFVFLPIFSKKTLVVFLKNVQILTDFSQKRLIFRVKGVWITDWFLTPDGWDGSNKFFHRPLSVMRHTWSCVKVRDGFS